MVIIFTAPTHHSFPPTLSCCGDTKTAAIWFLVSHSSRAEPYARDIESNRFSRFNRNFIQGQQLVRVDCFKAMELKSGGSAYLRGCPRPPVAAYFYFLEMCCQ